MAAGPDGKSAGRLKKGTRTPRSPLYRSLARATSSLRASALRICRGLPGPKGIIFIPMRSRDAIINSLMPPLGRSLVTALMGYP